MGIMVYSLLWVMQDFDHQPYPPKLRKAPKRAKQKADTPHARVH